LKNRFGHDERPDATRRPDIALCDILQRLIEIPR
jgi:hypothetical protein